MKFGFHTQMNNWQHQATHTQMLDDIREQVQLCEQLGFDAVWLPEHHLNPEGLGNSPNPILFAADLACRTNRIKIGFACLPTTIHDLARLDARREFATRLFSKVHAPQVMRSELGQPNWRG